MGNRVSSTRPTYITIYGDHNAVDSKALEKFDQTSKLDAALSVPTGMNPSYAEFSTGRDMRAFAGLSNDLLNADSDIFDDMMPCLQGQNGCVQGSVVSTVDFYEKTRKIGNWLGGTYGRGWRQNNADHEEIESRMDSFTNAYRSIFNGTFDKMGHTSGGDLAHFYPHNWVNVVPRELSTTARFDGRLFLDEYADKHCWLYRLNTDTIVSPDAVSGMDLEELWESYGPCMQLLDDRLSDVESLDDLTYLACFNGAMMRMDLHDIVGSLPSILNGDRRGVSVCETFDLDSSVECVVRYPLFSSSDFTEDRCNLEALLDAWLQGVLTPREVSDGLLACQCTYEFFQRLDAGWDSVSVLYSHMCEKFQFTYDEDAVNRVHQRFDVFRDPIIAMIFLLFRGFGVSRPSAVCSDVCRLVRDGKNLRMAMLMDISFNDAAERYVASFMSRDSADFLKGLKEKAIKLRGVVAGSLKPALKEGASATEKIMTGWLKQKADTVKQAVVNGVASLMLDTKADAEAKADVYGSMVQGRHVLALPSSSKAQVIADNVHPDARASALDHIDRVGHEIGIRAKVPGEKDEDSVVENHIVSEMALRTKTGAGTVGNISRSLQKASDVMKEVVPENVIVSPQEASVSTFPIHTRPYHVSLVDGCDMFHLTSPGKNLESGATFSPSGVIVGQLKTGVSLSVLDVSHHQVDRGNVKATLCAVYFFSFSPASCHVSYANGSADHDMNINVEITAAIRHDTSNDSNGTKKHYIGLIGRSPRVQDHSTDHGFGLVTAIGPNKSTHHTGTGIWIGRLGFNLASLQISGLNHVTGLPMYGTFGFGVAVEGTVADNKKNETHASKYIDKISVDVRLGECIITPRGLDRYLIYNRERISHKSIFDFVGLVGATVSVSEAPQDVIAAWGEMTGPLLPYLPLVVGDYMDSSKLHIVKSRYRTVLKQMTQEDSKIGLTTDKKVDEWVITAILALPVWMRTFVGNPLLQLGNQERMKNVSIMLFTTIYACIPAASFRATSASNLASAAVRMKEVADFEAKYIE
nr:VP4 [Tarumizu tick virus]